MKTRHITFTLILMALIVSACNLSRVTPTPTLAPPTDLPPLPLDPSINAGATPIVIEGENGELCIVPSDWYTYTIEQGDTLSLLADQTGSTQEELMRVNCITNPNNLVEGETFYVPRPPVIGS